MYNFEDPKNNCSESETKERILRRHMIFVTLGTKL